MEIADVESVMEKLLKRGGKKVLLMGVDVPYDCAAAADGLLPAFLLTGEALWREAKGVGFGLVTARDDGALLGFRLTDIGARVFTELMLAAMEATAQATRPEGIIVEDLDRVWAESRARYEADQREGRLEL